MVNNCCKGSTKIYLIVFVTLQVNSKKFRGEMMPSKSPMKKPTLPPPSAKSKPKSRAAAQKAKKLFAMDGYSIFDESP